MDGLNWPRVCASIASSLALWFALVPFTLAGTLSGTTGAAPSTVNLTSEGTLDWIHWGRTSVNTNADRKSGVPARISNWAPFGGTNPAPSTSATTAYAWSDGTPLAASTGDKRGLRTYNVGRGMSFTAAADGSSRTLKVYVGASGVKARLTATLSDGSAPPFTTLIDAPSTKIGRVVTLTYQANSAGQTLQLIFTVDSLYAVDARWASLESAALQGAGSASMPLPYVNTFSGTTASGWQPVDDAGTASGWSVQNGQYRQGNSMGVLGNALAGGYHRGTYAYLSAGTTLTDYRFDVDATSLSATAEDIGVMVRLNPGSGSYIRLSTNGANGFARLESRTGSAFTTLAKNARGHQTGAPVNLGLEVKGAVIVARLNGAKLFGAYQPVLSTGTVALYCRDACAFDNVNVQANTSTPTIAIAAPVAYSVAAASPLAVSAVVLNRPVGAKVSFALDGVPCSAAVEQVSGTYYSASCSAPGHGTYELETELRTSSGALLDSHTAVGIGIGDNYVALGDSITYGSDDNTASDGRSADGWVVSTQGFSARLTDLLNASRSRPSIVHRAGIPGDTSANMLNDRLTSWLEQYADSTSALVTIGVNDANGALMTPSGLGCSGSACSGTFKGNLQSIVDRMAARGKSVMVSRVPPRFGDPFQAPYANPQANSRNLLIRDGYNRVIETELANRRLGPDLYDYFLGSENRFYLYATNLHPNALGYEIIAQLLHDRLTGSATPPFVASAICLRRVSAGACVAPLPYKQNLLEPGDRHYVDVAYTLTGSIPSALANGRWIMTANADRDLANSDYLAFNVPEPSTVYVAYDAGATSRPAWLRQYYSDSGLRITTSNPNAPSMRLYRRQNVSGSVVLGGGAGSSNGADANFVVIVVKN